ncbi:MAG: hypothetical protein AAGD14_09855 [Planctomycetota bacterium]
MELEPGPIVSTTQRLQRRILERFPDSSLGTQVAQRVVEVAQDARRQAADLARPHYFLRGATWLLVLSIPVMLGLMVTKIGLHLDIKDLEEFVPFVQAAVESFIFLGAGILFLMTLENRLKRARVLRAARELRGLAHLVDMHQLDKDPVYVIDGGPTTESSPKRTMTAFELNRYFDYCCELLSLLGKLAALYSENLDDPVAVSAVDEVESLTTGLSRKIWQKSMMLPRASG